MAFDIGAGISAAATAISTLAGTAGLEAKRAELEREKIKFAAELSATAQEKQNIYLTGERLSGQDFQGTQKGLDRTSAENMETSRREASLAVANINSQSAKYTADQRSKDVEAGLTPLEVRTANWWASATPPQRDAFAAVVAAKLQPIKPPEGYRYMPNGNLEYIPGGPTDPVMVKRSKEMNAEQAKAAGFADRMLSTVPLLDSLDKEGTSAWNRVQEAAGKGGTFLQSETYQLFRQAKDDFINAQLRWESGAAISADEFAKADRQYFPQPGEGVNVIAQKAKNRQIAVEAMKLAAGSTYTQSAVSKPLAALPPLEERVVDRIYYLPSGLNFWRRTLVPATDGKPAVVNYGWEPVGGKR